MLQNMCVSSAHIQDLILSYFYTKYKVKTTHYQMRSACQIVCELMNLIQVDSSFKKTNFLLFSHSVPSHLILKYTIMLHILIHYIVHLNLFDEAMKPVRHVQCHAQPLPCMPPAMHARYYHVYSPLPCMPPTMHTLLPCMPSCHACPLPGTEFLTYTCENLCCRR